MISEWEEVLPPGSLSWAERVLCLAWGGMALPLCLRPWGLHPAGILHRHCWLFCRQHTQNGSVASCWPPQVGHMGVTEESWRSCTGACWDVPEQAAEDPLFLMRLEMHKVRVGEAQFGESCFYFTSHGLEIKSEVCHHPICLLSVTCVTDVSALPDKPQRWEGMEPSSHPKADLETSTSF